MSRPSITLDTSVLLEYLKNQKERATVERLLELSQSGNLDLVVTARIREDVPRPPLSETINHMYELNVQEGASVARPGFWVLGRDVLGSDKFAIGAQELNGKFMHVAKHHRTGGTPETWLAEFWRDGIP